MLNLLFFCFLSAQSFCQNESYDFEGIYDDKVFGGKYELIARYLPFNPHVYTSNPHEIKQAFPMAIFSPFKEKIDLLIIDEFTSPDLKNFEKCTVIYTINNLSDVKDIVQNHNFILLCGKKFSEKESYGIFVRRDKFDVMHRSLSHTENCPSSPWQSYHHHDITKLLKPALNKTHQYSFPGVDFIYMINLDERPEKFTLCTQNLSDYGIVPYRFSAVNGWKLPHDILEKIGVKFATLPTEKIYATVYRFVNGNEYKSNEYIENPDQTYFCYGLTRGAIGIIMSHLSIMQDAFNSNYETIWVMEDDVLVINNPAELTYLIGELNILDPNWDILFTDVDSRDKQGKLVPCRAVALRPNFETNPLSFFLNKFYAVHPKISRCGMRYGAYSMIIKRSGIEKILNFYKNYQIYLPYDMDFWLIPELRMYCPNYDIVSTIPSALSDNYTPGYTATVSALPSFWTTEPDEEG